MAGQGTRSAGGGSRGSGDTYVRYRRHGKPEREGGHGSGEVLLLLLREDLIVLVRRAAVPRHEGIHSGLFFVVGWSVASVDISESSGELQSVFEMRASVWRAGMDGMVWLRLEVGGWRS